MPELNKVAVFSSMSECCAFILVAGCEVSRVLLWKQFHMQVSCETDRPAFRHASGLGRARSNWQSSSQLYMMIHIQTETPPEPET